MMTEDQHEQETVEMLTELKALCRKFKFSDLVVGIDHFEKHIHDGHFDSNNDIIRLNNFCLDAVDRARDLLATKDVNALLARVFRRKND